MKLSFNQRLESVCKEKKNYLCIGLDIDPDKFPSGRDTSLDGMETFGKEVIDGTIILNNNPKRFATFLIFSLWM